MSSNSLLKEYIKIIESFDAPVEEAAQQVDIIGYNSGTGYTLQKAMNDPKARRKVNMLGIEMGSNGQPVLKFKELDGDGPFRAEWDPKIGWHADFD